VSFPGKLPSSHSTGTAGRSFEKILKKNAERRLPYIPFGNWRSIHGRKTDGALSGVGQRISDVENEAALKTLLLLIIT
jgi:hypothetical protein